MKANEIKMNAYMYILLCDDGSTRDLEQRLEEHFNGEGANYTRKHKPVKLVYFEEFERIDEAYYREKQVQGWSRKKKEALINGMEEKLPKLSKNYTQFGKYVEHAPSTSSGSDNKPPVESVETKVTELRNNRNVHSTGSGSEKQSNSENECSTALTSETSKNPPIELVETKETEFRDNRIVPSTGSGSDNNPPTELVEVKDN